jgi:hypothetical protein
VGLLDGASLEVSLNGITVDLHSLYLEIAKLGGIDRAILSSFMPTVLKKLRVPLKMKNELVSLYVDRLYLLELQQLWKGVKLPNMNTVLLYTKRGSLWKPRKDVPTASSMTFTMARTETASHDVGPLSSGRLEHLPSVPSLHQGAERSRVRVGDKEAAVECKSSRGEMEEMYQTLQVAVLAPSLAYYDETRDVHHDHSSS